MREEINVVLVPETKGIKYALPISPRYVNVTDLGRLPKGSQVYKSQTNEQGDQQEMTPRERAETILPCICLDAYKDRSLIQPDCPRCNYADEMADAITEAASPTNPVHY